MQSATADVEVQIVSRRVIRPQPAISPGGVPPEPPESMHLTPWDLHMITVDYIQKGLLLPKPQEGSDQARHLGITILLRCDGEGAEFVHAVAPDLTAGDITAPVYIPPVVWSLFPLNGALGADVSCPVLAAQVTELADGVFVAMSFVGDAAGEISRDTPSPVLDRWFIDRCPVPIVLPFDKLEDIIAPAAGVRAGAGVLLRILVGECTEAEGEGERRDVRHGGGDHLVAAGPSRARMASGVSRQGAPAGAGDDVHPPRRVPRSGERCSTRLRWECRDGGHGQVRRRRGRGEGPGLGAWQLNRTVAAFDEEAVRGELASWPRDPTFVYAAAAPSPSREEEEAATVATGSSPRLDVYGNDFGWGKPVAVRSGAGNKMDGKVTVYEGIDGGGSMALEVCLSARALARLVADEEFMAAVSAGGGAVA
ncbi:unnamed protein product [Urochloa decumbens]|uniref:Acetyltransferase n=1 Tax=Urochloa decumbens TaxID=240449 RepID=A0ABC9BTT4_9POAL